MSIRNWVDEVKRTEFMRINFFFFKQKTAYEITR